MSIVATTPTTGAKRASMCSNGEMVQDAERWNRRYEGELAAEPLAPIGLDTTSIPAGGLFLDVACGLGAQSVWAALNGFDVVALDVSEVAVAATERFAEEHRVADRVVARVYDLSAGIPNDLTGECDVVACQRYRDPQLYAGLVEAAVPGGIIVVTVLSQIGLDSEPGPHHAPPGELIGAFAALDVEILSHESRDGLSTLVARRE